MDLQTLEREIQQEAKIDKAIDGIVNKWLKLNRNFRRTDKKENSTAMFVFIRKDLSRFTIAYNKKDNPVLDRYVSDDSLTVVFVKKQKSTR